MVRIGFIVNQLSPSLRLFLPIYQLNFSIDNSVSSETCSFRYRGLFLPCLLRVTHHVHSYLQGWCTCFPLHTVRPVAFE